ncbi:hypothetical protein [Bdellovibrio sp. HCB337]|uniref:hypothetical protein n=1 Tax=Bdellovibrio sp. HCB337 TaxID=3394358 RepID=UPI0039A609E1
MKFLTLLFLILTPIAGMAQSASDCVSQQETDDFFESFKVFEWSNSKNDYLRVTRISDRCDSAALLPRLVKAVKFMDDLNASKNPQSPSIVVREGAGNYFKKRIARIVIEGKDAFNCPSGVIAYVYRMEQDIMHICTEGIENYNSPLMVSSVLIHEARHTEGYTHVHCTHGMYRKSDNDASGSGSCDDTFETQGSYGVATGFLAEIAKSSTNPAQRQQARSTVVVDMIQRFNKLPLELKVGMVVQTSEGVVSFYDGTSRQNLIQVGNADTVMTSRLDLPTFFDPSGFVKSYAFSKTLIETQGGYAKDYVTSYTPAERNSLKDAYYGILHDYSCLLFDQKLRCGDNFASAPDIDVSLRDIRPIQFLISDKSKYVNNEVLYISAEDGYLYPLPAKWADFKAWAATGKLTPSSKAFNWKSLVSFDQGQTEFAVDLKGNLEYKSSNGFFWRNVKPYNDDQIQKVISPFFWSKKLEEI